MNTCTKLQLTVEPRDTFLEIVARYSRQILKAITETPN
jgi:hypothetical protein